MYVPFMPSEHASSGSQSPRLLDRLRTALRSRHYSLRTEDAYVAWVRRFIVFNGKRHPEEMGEEEINTHVLNRAGGRGIMSPIDQLEDSCRVHLSV